MTEIPINISAQKLSVVDRDANPHSLTHSLTPDVWRNH